MPPGLAATCAVRDAIVNVDVCMSLPVPARRPDPTWSLITVRPKTSLGVITITFEARVAVMIRSFA